MPDEKWVSAIVAVLLGIVGVAVIAVLVSGKSNTSSVIGAGTGGFACILKTALTGQNSCNNLTESVTSNITFG